VEYTYGLDTLSDVYKVSSTNAPTLEPTTAYEPSALPTTWAPSPVPTTETLALDVLVSGPEDRHMEFGDRAGAHVGQSDELDFTIRFTGPDTKVADVTVRLCEGTPPAAARIASFQGPILVARPRPYPRRSAAADTCTDADGQFVAEVAFMVRVAHGGAGLSQGQTCEDHSYGAERHRPLGARRGGAESLRPSNLEQNRNAPPTQVRRDHVRRARLLQHQRQRQLRRQRPLLGRVPERRIDHRIL